MEKKRSYFNLEETMKQAIDRFAGLNPEEIALRSGIAYDPVHHTLSVPFIGEQYLVEHPGGLVRTEQGEEASLYNSIIMLHYLNTADGTPLTGQWIAFRHLPGGDIYIGPFQNRAVTPFLKTFGDRPTDFKKAAAGLGGKEQKISGISMVIPVLPRIPLCFTIWPGDEEMPASANILFDQAAASYLPTEDYAHLPALVNGAMKNLL
jgi:hypothetical protein